MSKFLQESLFITLLLITLISTKSFSKGLARHERQFIDMSSLDTQKDLYVEAAGFFLKDKILKFSPTSGGVNNVVQYVETSDNEKFVLRIYNNGLNSPRVMFEHEVLDKLRGKPLSFKIPTSMLSLESRESSVTLSNGAKASLFELIPGELPKLTRVKQIGEASGELSKILGELSAMTLPCPTLPYYDLYKVHHAVSRRLFFKEVASPAFDECRVPTEYLVAAIVDMEGKLKAYQAKDLPKQLIHGDLHYDNILCDGDNVSGLLDFEFCALDWRAMEIAICLSKYAGEKEAMEYFDLFVSGFSKYGILTEDEIQSIPDLINLRILSNVVYFVGRKLGNEDTIEALTSRAATYAGRVKWIKDNSEAIVTMISSKMKKII